MKKFSKTEDELKKSVAYEKKAYSKKKETGKKDLVVNIDDKSCNRKL